MKTHKKVAPPTVGGSSLLVIFAVLCLTTFTLLALSTAQANKRLSDASIRQKQFLQSSVRVRSQVKYILTTIFIPIPVPYLIHKNLSLNSKKKKKLGLFFVGRLYLP